MTTDEELGNRLKEARINLRLTQENAAKQIGLSRTALTQIESGQRKINIIEFNKLTKLYCLSSDEIFEIDGKYQESFQLLFRTALPQEKLVESQAQVMKALELMSELSSLEKLLDLCKLNYSSLNYSNLTIPDKWTAIMQGESFGASERKRLELGAQPIDNIAKVLNNENIMVLEMELNNDVSGFTINKKNLRPLIVINQNHSCYRRRFTMAHEFAHVLFDGLKPVIISKGSNDKEFIEVRANAFAASFLMPAEGIRQKILALGKEGMSRLQYELYDEKQVDSVEIRPSNSINELQLYHIAYMAQYYGVSRKAVLYRLKSLRLLTPKQFDKLFADENKNGSLLSRYFEINNRHDFVENSVKTSCVNAFDNSVPPDNQFNDTERSANDNFNNYFLDLCFEAYRLNEISKAKFIELLSLAGISDRNEALSLAKIINAANDG